MKADPVARIIAENSRRLRIVNAPFDPLSGVGSIGSRFPLRLSDHPIPLQRLPDEMKDLPIIKALKKAGSIEAFLSSIDSPDHEIDRPKVIDLLARIRAKCDFPFWAAAFVRIKVKGGGQDVPFVLNLPQRRLVEAFERKRLAGEPVRLVLLKARQWGGSTCSQLYMAWLQLMREVGLNSLIIAHQGSGSDEIKDMFDRMIRQYPAFLLHPFGEPYSDNEPKLVGVGRSGAISRVPQRNCKIKIGTAERPDSCRGGDYNLVHLSEVGIWKKTDGKGPEDIVASACSGIRLAPLTMIVYESTAKGSDNFFHREYMAAKKGESQFQPMFISWFDIPWNSIPFADGELKRFAQSLYDNRRQQEPPNSRSESGAYLWQQWQRGATLQALKWYVEERKGKPCHEMMASETPSDDIEAFTFSGANVFDVMRVEALRRSCAPPLMVGEIESATAAPSGKQCLDGLHFAADDTAGRLSVWKLPEDDPQEDILRRYMVVVDVGVGRTAKADNSVILVLDRSGMLDADMPQCSVAAQWVGHIDIDLLAWKAAQVAKFYRNALLVVESNSIETHNLDYSGGDHSSTILDVVKASYSHIYARAQSPEQIAAGMPVRYGFHTNVASKTLIIDFLVRSVRERLWIERDEAAIEELLTYVQLPNGSYEAAKGCHDDRLMCRAIGLYLCYNEYPLPVAVSKASRPAGRKRRPPIFAAIN